MNEEEAQGESGTEKAGEAQEALNHAVARYRDIVAGGPGIIAEMVRGGSIEEVDASAEAARQAYKEVSRRIATEHEREVLVGNTVRSAQATGAALRPEAKIALGLRGK